MKNKWVEYSNLIACPLCGAQIQVYNSSIICKKKHCFDISKRGYINLVHKPSQKVYNAMLFRNRQFIYSYGFYDKVIDTIDELVLKYMKNKKELVILDAGCGDGTFIKRLCSKETCVKIGFDISKDAILEASRDSKNILWFVADLITIPLRDCSVDILFNIFTPANYNSFSRVLKSDGVLIKVVPGKEYLKELREIAGKEIKNNEYDEKRVIHYLKKNMTVIEVKNVYYKVLVNIEQVKKWIKMTPMLANVLLDENMLSNIKQVTVDVNICICRKGCRR